MTAATSANQREMIIPLPHSAQEIADVIGRDRALYLIGSLPTSGTRAWRRVLYIPWNMPADHWLIRLLGKADAEKLRRHFGGEILQPANCCFIAREYRDRAVAGMLRDGATVAQAAATVGLTEDWVRRRFRETRQRIAEGSAGMRRAGERA